MITIWKVGKPRTASDPLVRDKPDRTISAALETRAEALGYHVRVKSFTPEHFDKRFPTAFKKNEEPDIIVIGTMGSINGMKFQPKDREVESDPVGILAWNAQSGIPYWYLRTWTPPPVIVKGIGRDKRIRQALEKVTESLSGLQGQGGFEFLVRTSPNYEAAKSLALRSPDCDARGGGQPIPDDLKNLVAPVIKAYLGGSMALMGFEDADCFLPVVTDPWQSQVGEPKVCGYWGSDHLAFVQTASAYESLDALGWLTVLLVFRKQTSKWEFLTGSADPATNQAFAKKIPKIVARIAKPWTEGKEPTPARLLAPEDGQNPVPTPGERFGEFQWQPSASDDVVAEIAELAYNDDVRLFVTFRSGRSRPPAQISAGQLGTTHSEWRWRVWSISDSGALAFSNSRWFSH
jgi:hypothetical protein